MTKSSTERRTLFILNIAIIFSQCGKSSTEALSGKQELYIKGSNTELELVQKLSEELGSVNHDFMVTVEGGGSQTGIDGLIDGKIDIANVSRQMNEEELELCGKKRVKPTPVIFAVDAIAIVTNSKLGVDSLSIQQVASLFSGEITNWKELGGPDLPVHLYGRDENSGTNMFFKDKILHHDYSANIKTYSKYTKIIESVKNDISGVGYVSLGHVMDLNGRPSPDIWACYIYIEGGKAVSPYEVGAIVDGTYPIMRPLYQYCNGTPQGAIKKFIEFELSPKGQEIISKCGFFPISDNHKRINREKLVQ
ncbi:MAG TPA: phosphate ABC transporter substrate-binding protein [Flavobacteriales bacterium]|nr:phosphate ABC transporter substrate-binding protein [Flavobacteriales bacterium]